MQEYEFTNPFHRYLVNISVLGAEDAEKTKIQFLSSRSAYSSKRDRCEKR